MADPEITKSRHGFHTLRIERTRTTLGGRPIEPPEYRWRLVHDLDLDPQADASAWDWWIQAVGRERMEYDDLPELAADCASCGITLVIQPPPEEEIDRMP